MGCQKTARLESTRSEKPVPIVVLEGCDVTGKSMLAKALLQVSPGAKLLHLTYRWPNKMNLYHLAAFKWAVKQQAPLVILDRWWLSEYIYAGVYRGGSRFKTLDIELDALAIQYGVCYCVCRRRDKYVQMQAHKIASKKRKEMYAPNEDIGRLHDWYTSMYGRNSFRPDWFSYNLDMEGGNILAKATHLFQAAMALATMANVQETLR